MGRPKRQPLLTDCFASVLLLNPKKPSSSTSCSSAVCSLPVLRIPDCQISKNGMPLRGDAISSCIHYYGSADTGGASKHNARSHTSEASRSSNLIKYETYSCFSALFPPCCQLVSCGRLSVPPCPCGDGVVRAIQVSVHLPKSRQTRSPPWRRRNCASTAGYVHALEVLPAKGTHPIHNPPLACSLD